MDMQQLLKRIRAEDRPYPYAIGAVRVVVDSPGYTDAQRLDQIREVLRALDLALADR